MVIYGNCLSNFVGKAITSQVIGKFPLLAFLALVLPSDAKISTVLCWMTQA